MNNLINAPNAGIPALSHLNPTMTLPDGELWLPPASAGAESLEALPHTALDLDLDMLSGGATSLNLTALVTTLKTQLAEANRLKAQVEGENLKLRSQVNLGHELNGLLAQAKNERDNLKAQLIEANSVNARLAGENSNLKQDYDDLFEALTGVEKERDAAVERKLALLKQITEAVSILRA
jgi:chromosome segregation ATPase